MKLMLIKTPRKGQVWMKMKVVHNPKADVEFLNPVGSVVVIDEMLSNQDAARVHSQTANLSSIIDLDILNEFWKRIA